MDESVIWEKLHGNRKIARGKVECYLNNCKCKLHSHPCDYILVMCSYSTEMASELA